MSIVKLAKNGDITAIAELINRALNPQNITAQVTVKNNNLIVILESQKALNQIELVKYIYKGLSKINTLPYSNLVIYGKRIDQDHPEWKQELNLHSSFDLSTLQTSQKTVTENSENQLLTKPFSPSQNQEHNLVNTNNVVTSSAIVPVIKEDQNLAEKALKSLSINTIFLQKISHIIIILLGIVISSQALFIIYNIFISLSQSFYAMISIIDITGILSSWIEQVLTIIYEFWDFWKTLQSLLEKATYLFLLIWVYLINATLRKIFNDYPITPWGGVGRFAIPGYNLFGVWEVFSTLSDYLIKQERELAKKGEKIKQYLPWLYTSIFAYMIVYIIYVIYATNQEQDNYITSLLYLLVDLMFICRSILYLQIIKVSYKAVLLQSNLFKNKFTKI
jgi:hypothetical protein